MATAAGDELEKILPSVDNTPLDPDDNLFDVKKALIPVVAEWRAIGEGLRLRGGTLNVINKNHPNDAISCMGAVASEWLNRNYSIDRFGEPTWRKLVEIIGSPMGGNNLNHARKIAQQYPGSTPPSLMRSDTISKEVAALREKVQEQSDSSRKEVAALREQVEEMARSQRLPPTKHESVDERSIPQQKKREHQPPPLPWWFSQLNDREARIVGGPIGFGSAISDYEADSLAGNLRVNKTLEALTFDNVKFSTNGQATVLASLHDNKSVKTLHLFSMTLSDMDSEVLAQVLRINTTIATLWLVNVNISDVGFTTLAEAMRDNQSLTTLNLGGTKISDSGAIALATAIQDNKTLQALVVTFMSVSDGGARDFAKKMEGWGSSLKTLQIYSTRNISGEVKELLRETARRKGIALSFYDYL